MASVEGVPPDTSTHRDLAVTLYQETDMPAGRIAEILRVSRGTVYNWLNAAGVSGDRRAGATAPGGHQPVIPEMELDNLTRAVERGFDRLESSLREQSREQREIMASLARLIGLLEGFVGAQSDRKKT